MELWRRLLLLSTIKITATTIARLRPLLVATRVDLSEDCRAGFAVSLHVVEEGSDLLRQWALFKWEC